MALQGLRQHASKVDAKAAANLAFLHGLAGKPLAAEGCADAALEDDHYSAVALVNKVGACMIEVMHRQQTSRATCFVAEYISALEQVAAVLSGVWSYDPFKPVGGRSSALLADSRLSCCT